MPTANSRHGGSNARRWITVIVVFTVAVILAGAGLAIYIVKSPSSFETNAPLGTLIPTTPMAAPPAETPSATPPPPTSTNDFVAQAMPDGFTIACGGDTLVSASQLTTTQPVDGGIRNGKKVIDLAVPGDSIALVSHRLATWAHLPGSDAGPVSIAGHADAAPNRMAFNPIAEYRGDTSSCRSVIQVPGGVLTYDFAQAYSAPKEVWLSTLGKMSASGEKGKLFIATCSTASDTVIWEFRLVSSKAA